MVRSIFIVAMIVAAASASADPTNTAAATPFAERHALLAADVNCGLLGGGARLAVEAGASQARSALLRAGWRSDNLDAIANQAAAVARTKPCDDQAIRAAASNARQGFAAWSRFNEMRFPGARAEWVARRTPEPQGGWFLYQATSNGRFGLRSTETAPQLLFWINQSAAAARLIVRDPQRAAAPVLSGLSDFGDTVRIADPAIATAQVFHARARAVEARGVRFQFDDAALAAMTKLDSREVAVLEIETATGPVRQRIEIGDLAAARAFLLARPD